MSEGRFRVCIECGQGYDVVEDRGRFEESNNGKFYVCSECSYNCQYGGCS